MTRRMVRWMAACALLAGCGEGGLTGVDGARTGLAGGERVKARALFANPMFSSGIEARLRDVVRGQEGWTAFWNEAWERHSPLPAAPAVDFAREMVVVASMGGRASGGFRITIDSVAATAGGVHVFVTERSPGSSCVVTAAITAPVDAVAVPASDLPVTFHERTVVHDCGR